MGLESSFSNRTIFEKNWRFKTHKNLCFFTNLRGFLLLALDPFHAGCRQDERWSQPFGAHVNASTELGGGVRFWTLKSGFPLILTDTLFLAVGGVIKISSLQRLQCFAPQFVMKLNVSRYHTYTQITITHVFSFFSWQAHVLLHVISANFSIQCLHSFFERGLDDPRFC